MKLGSMTDLSIDATANNVFIQTHQRACGEYMPAELSPTGDKVLFDIGCNKGYTSAKFFALWAPELQFNPSSLHFWRPEVYCGNW
jgi:hypothetical protein